MLNNIFIGLHSLLTAEGEMIGHLFKITASEFEVKADFIVPVLTSKSIKCLFAFIFLERNVLGI